MQPICQPATQGPSRPFLGWYVLAVDSLCPPSTSLPRHRLTSGLQGVSMLVSASIGRIKPTSDRLLWRFIDILRAETDTIMCPVGAVWVALGGHCSRPERSPRAGYVVKLVSPLRVQGYSMALAGNSLLFTYFVGRQESSAALIQGLGVVSNFTLLVQVHSCTHNFFPGHRPFELQKIMIANRFMC